MNILITGALGATGTVLSAYLSKINPDLYVFTSDIKNYDGPNYFMCDLAEESAVCELLITVQPQKLFHLAGTFANNFDIDFLCNVKTTKNIFDAILNLGLKTRVLLVGSSAEYGLVKEEDNPIKESQPLNPCSIYGLTKVYQTQLMQYYYSLNSIDALMVRPFNLIGECLSEKLFIGNLYTQMQKFKNGDIEKITLGNLQNKRDYITIEKAVEYYYQVMMNGISGGIYNVGSGRSETIKIILERILLKNNIDLNCVEEKVFVNDNKLDIKDIYADVSKIKYL